jgi:xyloglucan-specific exo-beta-1,4-glucanase
MITGGSMKHSLFKCGTVLIICHFMLSASEAFRWSTVAIGGGGFVSSIVASSVEENLFYARTDVGGAYRWDATSERWNSMMDWVDVSQRGLLGVEAIAADPQNPDNVYMMTGTTYWNEGRSAFLRSSDRGRTWEVIYTWDTAGTKGSVRQWYFVHGNGMGRGNGEALAIDPNNSDIMFYGSRAKGLFRSSDNGTSWEHVDAFTTTAGSDTTWNGAGFSFVTFAPGSSQQLYAGFLRSNDNVFTSADGGKTWSLLPGRPHPETTGGYAPPLMPQRIAVIPDGSRLYITFGDGAGPHTMAWDEGWGPINDWFNRGAVLKYEATTGTWTDVSPENFIDPADNSDPNYYDEDSVYVACYGGISLNPSNPLEMVVSSIGYRGPQFWYEESGGNWIDQWGTNIYYSSDGGATWTPSFQYYWMDGGIYPTAEQMDENGIGWMFNSSIHWSGSIVMNPFKPEQVVVTSGNGVFRTDDITAFTVDSTRSPPLQQRTVWKVVSHGIEEVVPEEVISIPGGPLISVIGDYDGFRHDDVTEYPLQRHLTNVSGTLTSLGSTRALAFAPKSGRLVKVADVRSINPTGNNDVPISPLQFSDDTGKTWTVAAYETISSDLKRASSVAISADGEVTLWTPSHKTVDGNDVGGNYPVQRYTSSAWSEVGGIDGAYVVGDPEDAEVFYAFRKDEGTFHRSTDKGAAFTEVSIPGTSSFRKFRCVPGKTGDIWIPLAENGLARSIDGGETFEPLAGVTYCEAVGFGKAAPGADFFTIYIFGTVGNGTGIFQSIDEGAAWVQINDDMHEYGGLANGEFVVGDMNTYGVVYMSTAGRGIACRLPASLVAADRKKVTMAAKNPQAAWRINGKMLFLSPPAETRLQVTVYALSGQRLYVKTFTSPVRLNIDKVAHGDGMHILMIDDGMTRLCKRMVNIGR